MHEPDTTTFVVARDGTRLATDVYLPRRPGRVPAVIARTPYGKTSNVVWFPAIGRLFADNGMAFVAQDTRGRYASEGELAPFVEASTAGTPSSGSPASRGRTDRAPCSASPMSGSPPSPLQQPGIPRSGQPPSATRARTSKATGSATRACSGSSSSSVGRLPRGPARTTSHRSSTGRSGRPPRSSRPCRRSWVANGSRRCSTAGRRAAGLSACTRAGPRSPPSSIECGYPRT